MTSNDISARLEEAWYRIERDAEAAKDSPGATFALEGFYRNLTDRERVAANQVLIDWVLSMDVKKRFDALALIDRFVVVDALPTLRRLAQKFEEATEPSSPYDWAKVNRIISRLTGQSSSA